MFESDATTVMMVIGGVISLMNMVIFFWKTKTGKEKWNSQKYIIDPIRIFVGGALFVFADTMFPGISPETKALIYPAVHAGSWAAHRGTKQFKRILPGQKVPK